MSGAAVPAVRPGVSPAKNYAGGTPEVAGETPAPLSLADILRMRSFRMSLPSRPAPGHRPKSARSRRSSRWTPSAAFGWVRWKLRNSSAANSSRNCIRLPPPSFPSRVPGAGLSPVFPARSAAWNEGRGNAESIIFCSNPIRENPCNSSVSAFEYFAYSAVKNPLPTFTPRTLR